jgi:hypothetical protein
MVAVGVAPGELALRRRFVGGLEASAVGGAAGSAKSAFSMSSDAGKPMGF